jgi:hypothetical protein
LLVATLLLLSLLLLLLLLLLDLSPLHPVWLLMLLAMQPAVLRCQLALMLELPCIADPRRNLLLPLLLRLLCHRLEAGPQTIAPAPMDHAGLEPTVLHFFRLPRSRHACWQELPSRTDSTQRAELPGRWPGGSALGACEKRLRAASA